MVAEEPEVVEDLEWESGSGLESVSEPVQARGSE